MPNISDLIKSFIVIHKLREARWTMMGLTPTYTWTYNDRMKSREYFKATSTVCKYKWLHNLLYKIKFFRRNNGQASSK
jgi:hypothetical protein